MNRREFVGGLGSAVAWPLAARAQQSLVPVIGFLHSQSRTSISPDRMAAYYSGLGEYGWVEGRNLRIEYRWADGRNESLPELAADLVRRRVAVISLPGTTAGAVAAKAATQTIPIVFLVGGDPVEYGLVASLDRPGGNLTGTALLNNDMMGKRLQMLIEIIPLANPIALLVNPTNAGTGEAETREAQLAAQRLGVTLRIVQASTSDEIDLAFASVAGLGIGALLVGGDAYFLAQRAQFAVLASKYALPVMYQYRDFAVAGGLLSYGANFPDGYRIVGAYTGRILKGERPADLPVQRSTRIELVLNMKTAKALGLTFPLALLGRADEVIE